MGTFVGLGGGHGTYHLVGCKGKFDSAFWEGQMSFKHRYSTDTTLSGSLWSKIKPHQNTVGTIVEAMGENVTVVGLDTDLAGNPKMQEKVGDQFEKRGFAGGFYWIGDWCRIGLTIGWCGHYRKSQVADLDVQNIKQPILGLMVGNYDGFYGSFDAYASSPTLLGGGAVNIGLGYKWSQTRLWIGSGEYPGKQKDQKGLGILKVSQGLGPLNFTLVAQGSGEDVPSANLGIDRKGGLSLTMQYLLP